MMSLRWARSAVLWVALFITAPALAEDPPATPSGTILHLTQTVERKVTRDRLSVEFRVEATGGNPKSVQAEINRRMTAALAKAKAVSSVKAQTGEYQTYRTNPTGADGKPKGAPEYQSVQTLSLTGEGFDDLLALAGDLEAQGLLMSGMNFDVLPATLRKVEDDMTADALNRVTERSRLVAANLGMRMARYRDLTVGNVEQPGGMRPPGAVMMARAEPSPMPAPAAEAGEATVSLTISAEIMLAAGG
jgi:predicted secreted protein